MKQEFKFKAWVASCGSREPGALLPREEDFMIRRFVPWAELRGPYGQAVRVDGLHMDAHDGKPYRVTITIEPDMPKLESGYEWNGERRIRRISDGIGFTVNDDGELYSGDNPTPVAALRGFRAAGLL